jgi:integrase
MAKWALTVSEASALLDALPALARAMDGVALLTGLRRGELFALRWKSLDLADAHLNVHEAVYEGAFGTPKTEAGVRRIPLSELTVQLLMDWKNHATRTEPDALGSWPGRGNRLNRAMCFVAGCFRRASNSVSQTPPG